MANTNKICLFGGSFVPEGWMRCDGQNGTPNLPPVVWGSEDWDQTSYLCCAPDNTSEDTFIGQIIPFAGNFAPKDWAFCDGRVMDVNKDGILFNVLDSRFGGDGQRTFCLPKFTDIPNESEQKVGIRYIICLEGTYPSRSRG